jgi:hypothetical protein
MPNEIRIGVYAFGVTIIALVAAILAKDGSWYAASLAALSAGIHLLSGIMTWRRRNWAPPVEEKPEEPGGLGA